MELTKRMYGTEMASVRGPFGLCSGMMGITGSKVCHNAGWFNRDGQLLGWGDLGTGNFAQIAKELPRHEVFIILDESAWRFNHCELKRRGITGFDYEQPGTDWVVEHASMLVRNGRCYTVDSMGYRYDGVRWETLRGIRFRAISREAARQIILFG